MRFKRTAGKFGGGEMSDGDRAAAEAAAATAPNRKIAATNNKKGASSAGKPAEGNASTARSGKRDAAPPAATEGGVGENKKEIEPELSSAVLAGGGQGVHAADTTRARPGGSSEAAGGRPTAGEVAGMQRPMNTTARTSRVESEPDSERRDGESAAHDPTEPPAAPRAGGEHPFSSAKKKSQSAGTGNGNGSDQGQTTPPADKKGGAAAGTAAPAAREDDVRRQPSDGAASRRSGRGGGDGGDQECSNLVADNPGGVCPAGGGHGGRGGLAARNGGVSSTGGDGGGAGVNAASDDVGAQQSGGVGGDAGPTNTPNIPRAVPTKPTRTQTLSLADVAAFVEADSVAADKAYTDALTAAQMQEAHYPADAKAPASQASQQQQATASAGTTAGGVAFSISDRDKQQQQLLYEGDCSAGDDGGLLWWHRQPPHMVFIQCQLAVLAVLVSMILVCWRRHGRMISVLYAQPAGVVTPCQVAKTP